MNIKRCPAPMDADDLRCVASVFFGHGCAGNEPSFTTRKSGFSVYGRPEPWDVLDCEYDLTIRCPSEAEANATAAALNRLAEHWL